MRYGGPLVAALCLLAVVTSVFMVVMFDAVDHLFIFLLVPVMLLIGVIPIALRVARGKFDLFEITIPYFMQFFLFYGVGAILTLFIRGVPYDSGVMAYLDLAVAYCTLGLACVMLSYGITGKLVPVREKSTGLTIGVVPVTILYTIGYAGILTNATLDRQVQALNVLISGMTSLISQIAFLTTFTMFYVLYLMMTKQGGRAYTMLFFGWIVPTQIIGLFLRIGNKTALVVAFMLPIIAYWYAKRRLAWKSVLAFGIVFVFVVFPLYYKIRNFSNPFYSQQYRLERSVQELTQERSVGSEDALRTVARRVAIINSVAVVIRECGATVDYQNGSTLWLGVISVAIPRFLWPDKPIINIGTQFGKTFRITGFANYSSVSLSMVGELYWNFHLIGVVLGMFVMGAWMRILYNRFGAGAGTDPVRLSMYVTLLYATVTASESNIGGLEGRLIKEAVILLLIERSFQLARSIRERRLAPDPGGFPILAR